MEINMTYKELIAQVSAKSNLAQTTVKQLLDNMQEVVGDQLAEKNEVVLGQLGKFSITERAARKGRNPRTGETLEIAAKTVPAFKPGKYLKDKVNP
jgi:DNA-binding protein HU-beta